MSWSKLELSPFPTLEMLNDHGTVFVYTTNMNKPPRPEIYQESEATCWLAAPFPKQLLTSKALLYTTGALSWLGCQEKIWKGWNLGTPDVSRGLASVLRTANKSIHIYIYILLLCYMILYNILLVLSKADAWPFAKRISGKINRMRPIFLGICQGFQRWPLTSLLWCLGRVQQVGMGQNQWREPPWMGWYMKVNVNMYIQ